jgi:RNA polymerase sigma factor (sigma-70 family)
VDRPALDSDAISASTATPADFAAIFDRHYDAVHAYLQRRIGRDLADELAAETFLIAFDGRARYDVSRPDARPWLFGIATNLLHRHQRHELRQLRAYARSAADPILDAFDGVDARIDASSVRRELVDALIQVPAEELDALLLFAWADFSYAEIGQALEIPIGTVRSRLSRARVRLRTALEVEHARAGANQSATREVTDERD